jgi:two-component system alkaline phosphatase synthesis response regulator PhoP
LVIDDDPDVRTLCKINLRYDGHEVIEAAGGAEGLELISSDHPDAVLLDVMMPNVDGIQVLRQLRGSEETADMPVVILSARISIEDQIEGIAAGADDYLTKPFSPRDLGAALDGASRIDPRDRETARESRLRRLTARVGDLR